MTRMDYNKSGSFNHAMKAYLAYDKRMHFSILARTLRRTIGLNLTLLILCRLTSIKNQPLQLE